MNWAQIIAASIVAGVAALNLYFTLKSNNERRIFDRQQKYVDRQSDAIETWWLFSIKPIKFKELGQLDQDNLLVKLIWLPPSCSIAARQLIEEDDGRARTAFREAVTNDINNRL